MRPLTPRQLREQLAHRPWLRGRRDHRIRRERKLLIAEPSQQLPEILDMDQVLRVLPSSDERDEPTFDAPGEAAEHPPAGWGPVGPHQARSYNEGAARTSRGLDLELRPAIVRAASLESTDRGHHSDPLHPARGSGGQHVARTLHIDALDLSTRDRFEVIRAVDQRGDVPAPKDLRLNLIAQPKGHCIAINRARGMRKPRYNPAGLDEATRQHPAHKPLRAGD